MLDSVLWLIIRIGFHLVLLGMVNSEYVVCSISITYRITISISLLAFYSYVLSWQCMNIRLLYLYVRYCHYMLSCSNDVWSYITMHCLIICSGAVTYSHVIPCRIMHDHVMYSHVLLLFCILRWIILSLLLFSQSYHALLPGLYGAWRWCITILLIVVYDNYAHVLLS